MILFEPNADDLSHIDQSRSLSRLLALAMVATGLGLCLAMFVGVTGAEPGVYSPAERGRILTIGSSVMLGGSLLAALMFLTSRRQVWLDRDARTVRAELRFLGIRRTQELPLTDAGILVHRDERVSNAEHSWTVRVVEYVCDEGRLELTRHKDSDAGRAWAERLSAYLGLPLEEHDFGAVTRREPDALDRSVTEQGLASGLAWPPRRISSRVSWTTAPRGGVEISVQPPGAGAGTAVGAALVVLAVAAAVWMLQRTGGASAPGLVIGALVCVVVLLPLGAIGVELVLATAVRVGRWRVGAEGFGPAGQAAATLPASGIEQVVVGDGALMAIGDAGSEAIGPGLDDADLEALRSVVLLSLAGRTPPME